MMAGKDGESKNSPVIVNVFLPHGRWAFARDSKKKYWMWVGSAHFHRT
jgi:hypothetical protein